MEIRKLNAARGWTWVKHGYQLIMRNPLLSLVTSAIAATGTLLVVLIPVMGPPLAVLLVPILIAGYMRVCRALEEEEEVELIHVLAGFQKHPARLAALGGFLILGLLIASFVVLAIGGQALTTLMDTVKYANDPQILIEAMWTAGSGVALSLIVGFTLTMLLMLAFQYAPMLVFFEDKMPFTAMRISLQGSLRNLLPYTVYSIIMQLITLALGILPFNLGLIFLLPIAFASMYVSYRNIFPFPGEITGAAPVAETDTPPADLPPQD